LRDVVGCYWCCLAFCSPQNSAVFILLWYCFVYCLFSWAGLYFFLMPFFCFSEHAIASMFFIFLIMFHKNCATLSVIIGVVLFVVFFGLCLFSMILLCHDMNLSSFLWIKNDFHFKTARCILFPDQRTKYSGLEEIWAETTKCSDLNNT